MLPGLAPIIRNIRGRLTLGEIVNSVIRECASSVIAGPFCGMRYIAEANGSALAPKLIGTYERELHSIIERVVNTVYDTVIDVGCAEGYYAVGFAMRMPQVIVEAFDIDASAVRNLQELAAINSVANRIRIRSECTFESFQAHYGKRCLVVCDIEGGEYDLLDPVRSPALKDFDIIVEVHDGLVSSRIHDQLVARFCQTHELEFIEYQGRHASEANKIRSIWHSRNRLMALNEWRTRGVEWGYFRAKKWRE
jgi:hypothetical protein